MAITFKKTPSSRPLLALLILELAISMAHGADTVPDHTTPLPVTPPSQSPVIVVNPTPVTVTPTPITVLPAPVTVLPTSVNIQPPQVNVLAPNVTVPTVVNVPPKNDLNEWAKVLIGALVTAAVFWIGFRTARRDRRADRARDRLEKRLSLFFDVLKDARRLNQVTASRVAEEKRLHDARHYVNTGASQPPPSQAQLQAQVAKSEDRILSLKDANAELRASLEANKVMAQVLFPTQKDRIADLLMALTALEQTSVTHYPFGSPSAIPFTQYYREAMSQLWQTYPAVQDAIYKLGMPLMAENAKQEKEERGERVKEDPTTSADAAEEW